MQFIEDCMLITEQSLTSTGIALSQTLYPAVALVSWSHFSSLKVAGLTKLYPKDSWIWTWDLVRKHIHYSGILVCLKYHCISVSGSDQFLGASFSTSATPELTLNKIQGSALGMVSQSSTQMIESKPDRPPSYSLSYPS